MRDARIDQRAITAARPPAPGCRNCGSRRDVRAYQARDIDARYNAPSFGLRLCDRCLRDRGAAWRWRWRIAGRQLPDQRAA